MIWGFVAFLVMATVVSGFAGLASADIRSESDVKFSSATIYVPNNNYSTTEQSLKVVGTESITIISAPSWLPQDMGFSYYSPGVEIGYSGLKNKKYPLRIWLLERTNWNCASHQICNKPIIIDNTAGNNTNGTIRITEVFNVHNNPTFDWVVRLYDGTTQVSWTELYATGTSNRPPQLSLIGDKTVITNDLLEFTISGIDPNGDELTYQADNLPYGASFNPENRTFRWRPTTNGNYSNIRFRVTDNGEGNLYDSEYITITVSPSPAPINRVCKGVCYGPFRDGQNPDQGIFPSETDIREDMPILKNMAEAIRTYGVCNGLEKIVPIANEFDLKVSPGAWICSNYEGNEEEINNLTSLAQNYEVETVIVGNEVVLRYENGWDTLTEAELVDYVTRVKENVSVPVTTGEPWHIWDNHTELVDEVDYILLYVHPYWEGVSIDNAPNYVVERYKEIQNKYQKRVVIGEVGWPTEGLPNGEAVPSVENQERFLEEFLKLADEKGISFYFFEAFDEKWKVEESVGPHWGFYYSNRTAKHSIDSVLPRLTSCDAAGNEKNQFAPGDTVYVKASGLEPTKNYKIWIQDDPVNASDTLIVEENPLSAETPKDVTTDSSGNLSVTPIWSIPQDATVNYHKYDIVLDKQNDGEYTGKYNGASDGIDSTSVAGFIAPIPELPTIILFSVGLLVLAGYAVSRRKNRER